MKPLFRILFIFYFSILVKIKLFFYKGKIIGVGGCYGKSSAVNLITSVLSQKYQVLSSFQQGKGLNSETGIPFTILDIKPDKYRFRDWAIYAIQGLLHLFNSIKADIIVLELGVDKPEDMKFLMSVVRPHIGILLNSNHTHSANFKELHQDTGKSYEVLIAEENGILFEQSKDIIFYNIDDPEVVSQIHRFKGQMKQSFSGIRELDIKMFEPSLNGTKISFEQDGSKYYLQYPQPLMEEYRSTFELSYKLALYFGLNPNFIISGWQSYVLPPSRSSLFKGKNGSYLLDSSYNSSLTPTVAALKLAQHIAPARLVAILGDMRELGTMSEEDHKKLASFVRLYSTVVLITGADMNAFFKPEFQHLISGSKAHTLLSFKTTKDLINFIRKDNYSFIYPKDTILVKGSQNTLFLEAIVEELLENPQDVKYLCRRDKHYEDERKKLLSI